MEPGLTIKSFEEFEKHLRDCKQWDSKYNDPYDIVGITLLFSAIIDNLKENIHIEEYDEISNILSQDRLEFLKQLIKQKSK